MKFAQSIRLTTKLIAGFSFGLVLVILMGLTGFYGIYTIKDELNEIIEVRLPSVDLLIEADRDLQRVLVAERSMIFANSKSPVFKQYREFSKCI